MKNVLILVMDHGVNVKMVTNGVMSIVKVCNGLTSFFTMRVSDEGCSRKTSFCAKLDFIMHIFVAFTYLHFIWDYLVFHNSDCKESWTIVDTIHDVRSERRSRN